MRDLAELFERFRTRGDLGALGEVFDRTSPRLIGLALHLCGNAADAEDLVQSTFVVAISKAATFEAGRSVEAWLSGILAGEARNAGRRAVMRRTQELPDLAGDAGDPQASAQRAECIAQIRQHVDTLPEEQRQALLLKLQHGLATAEIAEVLGVAPGAVRMRIHRGIQVLRRLLPASLAALPARGTKEIRMRVLEHARSLLPAPAAGGAIAALWTIKAAAVAACVLLGVLIWRSILVPEQVVADREPEPASARAVVAAAEGADRELQPGDALVPRLEAQPARSALRIRVVVQRPPGSAQATAPIANALVQLWPGERAHPPLDASLRELSTDENGEIQLSGLAPGPWSVAFLADWDANPQRVLIAPGAEALVEFVQARGRLVRGRVIDEHALPVADAEIWATEPGGFNVLGKHSIPRPWDPCLRLAGHSDERGRFEVALSTNETAIGARKVGFSPSRGYGAIRASSAEATLVLGSEWAAIYGTVLDQSAVPVLNAAVWVIPAGQDARRGADGIVLCPRLRQVTRTDANGRFWFNSLPAGEQRLWVQAPPYLGGMLDITLPAFGIAETALHVTAGIEIVGSVRHADGTPARGLGIAARSSRGANGHFAAVELREDGSFHLKHLPHRSLVLTVDSRGSHPLLEQELPSPAAGILRCDLTLPERPDLVGIVFDPDGAPLQRWDVIATAIDIERHVRVARTDQAGRFRIEDVLGTRFRISTRDAGGDPTDPACELEDIPAGASDIELRVPADRMPLAVIEGVLVNERETPWAGAELALCRRISPSDGPPLRRVTTDVDGSFRVDRLTGGRYALWLLREAGLPRRLMELELPRGQTHTLGVVRVAPLASLRIEARHLSGDPWRGDPPYYRLRDPMGNPPAGFVEFHADSSTFHVEAGAYRVEPRGPDLIAEPADVVLEPGESRVLQIPIAVGRTRTLVFNGDGLHRPEHRLPLQVEVRRADGSRCATAEVVQMPDLRGFRYWYLEQTYPFGRYSVTATTSSGLRYATSFEVREDLSDRTRIDVPLMH